MANRNSPTTTTMTCDVDALNSLLRGEISAVETYQQAVEKFDDSAHKVSLTKLRDEHDRAAQTLRDRVLSYNGEPSTASGPWGTFAALVTGTAKIIGPQSVLAALKQGEEHGISQYEKALENDGLTAECKNVVRTDLLPRCLKHVGQLEVMIASVEDATA